MLILVKQTKSVCAVAIAVVLVLSFGILYREINSLKNLNSEKEARIIKLKQQNVDLQKGLSKLEELTAINSELEKKFTQINKANKELQKTVDNLVIDNNSLRDTVKKAAESGISKPPKVGITPRFTVSSRGTNNFRQSLRSLSQGSYQHRQENISFNINDRTKWTKAGTWYVTRYTATVGECDTNPSITADNKLVTPGFTVAVDPAYWKYGTIFYFDGLGFGVAADCGGAVKGKKRADYLVASKKFSNILDNYRQVWVVYVPK